MRRAIQIYLSSVHCQVLGVSLNVITTSTTSDWCTAQWLLQLWERDKVPWSGTDESDISSISRSSNNESWPKTVAKAVWGYSFHFYNRKRESFGSNQYELSNHPPMSEKALYDLYPFICWGWADTKEKKGIDAYCTIKKCRKMFCSFSNSHSSPSPEFWVPRDSTKNEAVWSCATCK